MFTKAIGVVLALAVVGVGGYFLLSSNSSQTGHSTKEFSLAIQGNKLVGETTLRVKEGDTVVLKVTSDVEEEFHLHGYDRSIDLEPATEATLTFVADASGRYMFELEKGKVELGSIEVLP